jgi:translation initiation factor IF-2
LAKRVFELARELGVTSKVILQKCRAEGLEIKNHMSALSAGLVATISEWFSEDQGTHTAVETAEQVDLAKARAAAKKSRRRKAKKAKAPEREAEGKEAAAAEAAVAEAPVEAKAEAQAAEPALAEAPAPEAPAGAEALPAQAEAVAEAPPQAAEPARIAEPQEAEAEKKEERIVPAGPQVVPKPVELKGPRVVRVEAPETVARPYSYRTGPRRAGPEAPAETQPLPAGGKRRTREGEPVQEADERGKKTKRRSPRRKGGRSADSGEKLREWRDQDLLERSQRLAAAGTGLRRHRPSVSRKVSPTPTRARAGRVEIEEPITIKRLSAATGIKSAEIIRRLMQAGTLATVNQVIGQEQAEAVMLDFDIELAVKRAKTAEEELLEAFSARGDGEKVPRAPVATFLGHVDHGKTSLLDYIRKTSVAEGEAGGITQRIGAYRYDRAGSHVVFLDTPGHEAFTAMRARGANMTDVVVLVVAADDGVMPQTVEAISHARAANVPIVVALNKIDVPNANIQRALGQLAEQGLQSRQWGGETEVVQTSAVTGEGIEELVETLSLEAELLELKASPDGAANGYVIEAQMDPGRGVVARLLVLNGTLRVGDILLAGQGYGRVRQMTDDHGRAIDEAGPATPVEVAGLDGLPEAGDRFFVVEDLDRARAVSEERRQQARTRTLAASPPRTLEAIFNQIEAGELSEVALIVKADAQGSVEAICGSLEKLNTDQVRVNILHAAVGGISTGDVTLAEASDAIIIGFNVVPDNAARQMAEAKSVEIKLYRVIYDLIDDIRKALEEGLAPEIREETLGRAEIRQVFKISRVGTVAGCFVVDGNVSRNARVRVIRDNIVIEDERTLESLRRFKDDAREVRAGLECGLKIAGYDDIREGDVLEFYQQVEVARKL